MFTRLHRMSAKAAGTFPRMAAVAPKAKPYSKSGPASAAATAASSSFAKTSIVSTPIAATFRSKKMKQFGILGTGLAAAQWYLGDAENVFEHKFITSKKPEDLADFYGTEDFMEIFCVLPFMVKLMMRGAEFDDDGTIHAWGLLGPGELEVSIDFDETEIDTNGDGEPDTLSWFNKKEHFRDVAPAFLGGFTLWEMCQNFGYHRRDDGTCEVYHHGENFSGFFLVRLIFQIHSYYVIWATEKYINSDAFGTEDMDTEREEQRQNIPLHVFKEFIVNLTQGIENAKKDPEIDDKTKDELNATIRRLSTISARSDHDMVVSLPRLRTLRSHKTNVSHIQLVVDDKETSDTIRMAMKQIGSSKGKRHEPVKEIHNLSRRATIVSGNFNNKTTNKNEEEAKEG